MEKTFPTLRESEGDRLKTYPKLKTDSNLGVYAEGMKLPIGRNFTLFVNSEDCSNGRTYMKVLLGKKMAMSQVFANDGKVVPVTWIAASPLTVLGTRKNQAGDSVAIVGFDTMKHVAKPQVGFFGDLGSFRTVREFPLADGEAVERGAKIDVTTFTTGELVDIVGTVKGRGFQGVVKRHGFAGAPATHGHKDQLRKSGSIGAGGVQRVFKGMRMAGRMGNNRVTVKNLAVVAVDVERNMIAVKGAIPGARNSMVTILATDGNVWQK